MATSRIPPLEMESVDAPVAPSDSFVFALYMVIVRTILNAGDVKFSSAVIHGVNPSFTSDKTFVSFSVAVNMSVTLIKRGKFDPVPDQVYFNLYVASFPDFPLVSTFSSSPYDISSNEMRMAFQPRRTHLPEAVLLLLEKELEEEEEEEEDAWLLLSLDFQWHVRHRKMELGTGEHRHTQLHCNIPVYSSGNYEGACL
ncbi:hypothetical protein QVD17_20977 [Tagetes erecta]|uniref:Uncharacterized protein n=1 Tax=Tagetes erecta TaxID=13708 RepID=A0AAD8KMP1_TARER|nr:hypothetical protein QVD17_20977 [Tagetes erecta]